MSQKSEKKLRRAIRKEATHESLLWMDEVKKESFKHRYIICLAIMSKERMHPLILIPLSVVIPILLMIGAYVAGLRL